MFALQGGDILSRRFSLIQLCYCMSIEIFGFFSYFVTQSCSLLNFNRQKQSFLLSLLIVATVELKLDSKIQYGVKKTIGNAPIVFHCEIKPGLREIWLASTFSLESGSTVWQKSQCFLDCCNSTSDCCYARFLIIFLKTIVVPFM